MSQGDTPNRGAETPFPMAPFDAWAEWMRANMGAVSAAPGASVPWLTSSGVSTGEEAEELPEGAIRSDPLLSVFEKLWDANPIQNVLPIDWIEITRSLQTLWAREMSDPARAIERATEFNTRLFENTMRNWRRPPAACGASRRRRKTKKGVPTSGSPRPTGSRIPSTRRSRRIICWRPTTCWRRPKRPTARTRPSSGGSSSTSSSSWTPWPRSIISLPTRRR
jgi:hypothetical protein